MSSFFKFIIYTLNYFYLFLVIIFLYSKYNKKTIKTICNLVIHKKENKLIYIIKFCFKFLLIRFKKNT